MSETPTHSRETTPSEGGGQPNAVLQTPPGQSQPYWVHWPYWVLDAEELTRQLTQLTPRGDYSAQYASCQEQRDRVVAMGGRPNRAIREFSPDDTYPGSPNLKGEAALDEAFYWKDQADVWESFLVSKHGYQAREALRSMVHEVPSTAADTYDLHVELREYLRRSRRMSEPVAEYWQDDFFRKVLAKNQRLYDQRLGDLDTLIEELREEKEQELLRGDDAQDTQGMPSGNPPTEQGSFDLVDGAAGDERDAPLRSPFEPAEGDYDQPQANASTKRKRRPVEVDGAADDLRQDRNVSAPRKKRRRTTENRKGKGEQGKEQGQNTAGGQDNAQTPHETGAGKVKGWPKLKGVWRILGILGLGRGKRIEAQTRGSPVSKSCPGKSDSRASQPCTPPGTVLPYT